jgi:Ca-activated chloride channel family protein
MTFIWPTMLIFGLVLVPLLIALYLILQRRRRRFAARYGSLGLVQESTGRGIGSRRHIPPFLFMAGLIILLVGLARPQTEINLPRIEGTVILAFDVSGSMAANDMQPTRMEAAKAAARDFVQHQPPSVQIGIVAFSDTGFTVQAPTNDQDTILASINRLTPQRGTSVANGILVSLNTIAAMGKQNTNYYSSLTPEPTPTPTAVPQGAYSSAVIVLLTDGENNESPDPLEAAQAATKAGVRIYTVGLGSTQGVNLHVNGFTVHTTLDEATLQQIAQITGGTYYNADSKEALLKIYDNLNPQLIVKPEKTEVTSIFAGASVVILLIAGLFSLLWFSRLP